MSVAGTLKDRKDAAGKWTDPLVGLQFDEFQKFVHVRTEHGVPAGEIVAVAEYLCEWSRNLLNRAFGRTNEEELDRITALFRETAGQIRNWAKAVKEDDQLNRIGAFAQHIQQRTGFIEG